MHLPRDHGPIIVMLGHYCSTEIGHKVILVLIRQHDKFTLSGRKVQIVTKMLVQREVNGNSQILILASIKIYICSKRFSEALHLLYGIYKEDRICTNYVKLLYRHNVEIFFKKLGGSRFYLAAFFYFDSASLYADVFFLSYYNIRVSSIFQI